MNNHVSRKLIVRLLLAWITLSVLIGTVVLFIETRKIDAYVVALALRESRDFEKDHGNFLENPDRPHLQQLREESRKHIEDGYFIAVKIYNRDRELIAEANHPAARLIEEKISRHRLDIALTSRRPYKEPFSLEKTVQILQEGSRSFFDPELVIVFAGMAGSLHDEIGGADDKLLEDRLNGLIDRYFPTAL